MRGTAHEASAVTAATFITPATHGFLPRPLPPTETPPRGVAC
jgi:hypothetical protein